MDDVSDIPLSTRPPEGRRPNRLRRAGVGILSVMAAAFAAEAAVRVFHLGPPSYQPRRIESPGGVPFMQGRGVTVYQPNSTFTYWYDPAGDERHYYDPSGRITYHINPYGMRGPDVAPPKAPDTFRVFCLGDSFTFGEGVRDEDTYPVRLQTLLSEGMPQRRVEVLNGGVQGYGTRHEVAYFLMYGAAFHPDVVTLGFFLNDLTDAQETVRLAEHMLNLPDPSPLARVSRIWSIFERSRHASAAQQEYFYSIRRDFASDEWGVCKQLLGGMQQASQEMGFRFVVVVFPILWNLDGDYPFEDIHRQIAAGCREAGCESIDLLETFRGRRAESLWIHPTDQHPNEMADRLAAERIATYLLKDREAGAKP